MTDFEKIILERKLEYQEEIRRQEEAKAEAIRKEKEAKAMLRKLEALEDTEAKEGTSYKTFKKKAEEPVVVAETEAEGVVVEAAPKVETVVVEESPKKTYGTSRFLTGFATCGLIAALAFGGWKLTRESKVGLVKEAPDLNRDDAIAADVDAEETKEVVEAEAVTEDPGFVYDYENNVVIIKSNVDPNATYAYDFEANSADDTKFMDESGNAIPVQTEAGQTIVNPRVNSNLEANGEYVELTTERFEDFTAMLIQKYEGMGLQVSREKMIKYVMLRNIDKLRQDNNELITQIVGSQDMFEFITDACDVLDAIRNYNLLYFDKYHDTEGFISVAEAVFDENQKAKAFELEERVYQIGDAYQDEERYNELAYALMRDLYNPLNPISQLEDGVCYGMMSVDMYMVRTTFGTDRYIRLNDTNADLIQYFISFPGDDNEHSDNALMNGNVSNIIRLLSECNVNTRTK